MNACKTAATVARLLLTLLVISAPLSAQRRRPPAPRAQPPAQPAQAAPTFETLLAADSYKIYGEVRGLGQLLRSSGVNDILDPMIKLTNPPKELRTLVKWLNSQSDSLMTSRLMFAAWSSRPKLPNALVVIEFPSVEEAQKFEPQLRGFLPKLMPSPTPESSPAPDPAKGEKAEVKPKDTQPPAPPYILKQVGALVFISDAPFTFNALRPTGSKLLAEDHNFRQLHDRFTTDSVFLYFDVGAMEKEDQERLRKAEEEEKKRIEAEAATPQKSVEESQPDQLPPDVVPEMPPPPPAVSSEPGVVTTATLQAQSEPSQQGTVGPFPSPLALITGSLFSSRPTWPDAIGVAIAFDADSYVVRALLANKPEIKGNAIPFLPQLVSGPALTPEAPSILPADTELLINASLDYPLVYDTMVKAMTRLESASNQTIKDPQASPFATYEQRLGIKIKDDLIPLLGNEIAVSIPVKTLGIQPPQASPPAQKQAADEGSTPQTTKPSEPAPVLAIGIKDREGVRRLLPKIIDSLGFKGASMLAQTEKRDDTELVSYAGVLSYAFIGNFLVVSPDANAVRHVVDSYLNHQTLASDSSFRNYTRWQPRQVLGQVYVSPALMDGFSVITKNPNTALTDKLGDFLSRLSPAPEPVTFAISNEGLGPLHELHVPKNFVMLMIAGFATESNQPPEARNEAIAQSALRMIASAEATYQADAGNGTFGTLEQLAEQNLVPKALRENSTGYKVELSVSGTKFEATAVPVEYGKTGKRSFFVDESAVLRGADHGGAPATVADKPVQ